MWRRPAEPGLSDAEQQHLSPTSEQTFKPPPVVECLCQYHCLGIGRKVFNSHKVCLNCLQRHDLQHLRILAHGDTTALTVINTEATRKQTLKSNVEAYGRYLCAFEDPDYQYCRWRQPDLNLRGTRSNCVYVRRKGTACSRCWRRHLRKIRIIQYFTPTGLCHEAADQVVTRSERPEEDSEKIEDDVEGYNLVLG